MLFWLGLLCSLLLALSTSVFAQSQSSASTSPDPTLWDHNGSVVQLVAKGSSREFYYKEPRGGMLEAGAQAGSLLFRGQTKKRSILRNGLYFRSPLRTVSIPSQRANSHNYTRVKLTGQAPRIGRNCRVQGQLTDTLEFTLLKSDGVGRSGSADQERTVVSRFFNGKCRGFPERQQFGMLVEPKEEIGKIVEGEGYVACKLIPRSPAENRVAKGCSYGSPCEIDAKLGVHKYDVNIIEVQSLKSWESWKGTCYGPVAHLGDGEYSVGVIDVQTPNKVTVPVRCGFFLESFPEKS